MSTLLWCFADGAEDRLGPKRGTDGSAGLDLPLPESCSLDPGQVLVVDHKIIFIFPRSVYGRLELRSSVSASTTLAIKGQIIGMQTPARLAKF
jgi:dUTPase